MNFKTYYNDSNLSSELIYSDGRKLVITTYKDKSVLQIVKPDGFDNKKLFYKVLSYAKLNKKTIEQHHKALLGTVDVDYYSTVIGLKKIQQSA